MTPLQRRPRAAEFESWSTTEYSKTEFSPMAARPSYSPTCWRPSQQIWSRSSRRVLVLGLGAGFIPGYFAQRGAQVDVVEINAQTLRVAKAYFGYNPGKETKIYFEDARTFVRRCDSDYDVVLVDLFAGDGVPEHLLTKEFFDDARRCLTNTGVFGMNSWTDGGANDLLRHILSTVTHSFGRVAVFGQALHVFREHNKCVSFCCPKSRGAGQNSAPEI